MKEDDIRKREVFNKYLALVEEDVRNIFDSKTFITVDCPACGSSDFKFEFKKMGFQYKSCEACHTVFVNPRPHFDDLKKLYTASKSTTYWVNEFFKPLAGVRQEKIFRPRAKYISDICKGGKGWVVGDIGAGLGLFLEELRALWPEGRFIAIEPSIEAIDICMKKNLEVKCMPLEEVTGCDGHFNLLTAFELLDHLLDPYEFLVKTCSLLKPGGYFYSTVVNGLGFDTMLLWEKSKMFSPPLHLNIFNPRAVSTLFKKAGFEIVEISTPGNLDWDIVEGMIMEEGVKVGRFWDRLAHEASEEAKKGLQNWIARNNLSSHMRVIARKPIS
jgi:SAM-dependent methyltransferase